eukprot:2936292-Pyramimonas_sp.AAC.1
MDISRRFASLCQRGIRAWPASIQSATCSVLKKTRPRLGDRPDCFDRCQRLVATDGDASCAAAERGLVRTPLSK